MGRFGLAISVSVSEQQYRDLQAELRHIPNGAKTAARLAVNKAASRAYTRVVRGLSRLLNLKQKYIREVVKLVPATAATMVAKVRLLKQPIPLIDFGARQTRRGVVVKTRRGRPAELLRGTFLARMKSGHLGVFERRSRLNPALRRRVKVKRGGETSWTELPIEERFGPTPMGVFQNAPGLIEAELAAAQADLKRYLASEADFLLNRKKAAATED
jgi:hypothetical protein